MGVSTRVISAGQMPLFKDDVAHATPTAAFSMKEPFGDQVWLLHGWALGCSEAILRSLHDLFEQAPLRQMPTPNGWMSVEQTNCGLYGWVSSNTGYRYTNIDPASGRAWPAMPELLFDLAVRAAEHAGFAGFSPQACLVNRYAPGSKMGLHQDRDEADLTSPIVSVSLGLPAIFQLGGKRRSDPVQKISLLHGDVLVWGGVDRLRFHGVMPVRSGEHPELGAHRINLTFRRVG